MKRILVGTILTITIIAITFVAYATLTSSRTFPNTTGIAAIGVALFSDNACTIPITSIDWGMLAPSDVATHTIYVSNNGSVPVTLTMTVNNWNPTAAWTNFTMTWDKQNASLNRTSVIPAILTLSALPSATGIVAVTFDITIIGTH